MVERLDRWRLEMFNPCIDALSDNLLKNHLGLAAL
jgi:hypothetical protein